MTPLPHERGDDRSEAQRPPDATPDRQRADASDGSPPENGVSPWLANTAVRVGLTFVGVVLLLFAIGQAFGLPLLEFVAEALSSETGRWLVVAFFAILLIAAAQRIGSTA